MLSELYNIRTVMLEIGLLALAGIAIVALVLLIGVELYDLIVYGVTYVSPIQLV